MSLVFIMVGVLNIWIGLLPDPPGSTHFGEKTFGVKLIPWIYANTAIIVMGLIDIYFGVKSFLT